MKKRHDNGNDYRLPVLKTKSEASQNPEQFALFLEEVATHVATTFQEATD